MKEIKIKFVGFWKDWNPNNNLITNILKRYYHVRITEDDDKPDYIFCSVFGTPYEYLNYDGIRIFVSGENYSPDFNLVDYAIGYDRMTYGDRFLRFPIYLFDEINLKRTWCDKEKFCNFIYSHDRDDYAREKFCKCLSKYKPVDCAGTFLNNMPDGKVICRNEKEEFLKRYKFTIAFESVNTNGFITEKITDAYRFGTIPIYMGGTDIDMEFNDNCFIWCKSIEDFDSTINKIIKIDKDVSLYKAIWDEPLFKNPNYLDEENKKLESFLRQIIDSEYFNAYRRQIGPIGGWVKKYEKRYRLINKIEKNNSVKLIRNIMKERRK